VEGFYLEIDKLAKGKSLLEVTPRILEETNLIISDAKRIVPDDAYLARTHEFIPAGNNPVYPDVVVAMRAVLQSLGRFREKLAEETKTNAEVLNELTTISEAIRLRFEGEEVVSRDDLARRMGRAPSPRWLDGTGFGETYFDFEKLAASGLPIIKKRAKKQLALGSGE
jgi:hypothetical protein